MIYAKLKGRMRELNCSQTKLAVMLGITLQAVNGKLNGRTEFTVEEAQLITEYLNIDDP